MLKIYKKPGGIVKPFKSKLSFIYRIIDVFIIVFSLYILVLFNQVTWGLNYIAVAVLSVTFFNIFAGFYHIYVPLRNILLRKMISPLFLTWFTVMFFLLCAIYFTKTSEFYSRLILGIWFITTPVILFCSRVLVKKTLFFARERGFNSRKVAIAGIEKQGHELAKTILNTPGLGMNLIGFFDDGKSKDKSDLGGVSTPIVGDFNELVKLAEEKKVDVVYISISLKDQDVINSLIDKLRNSTVSVYLVPDFFEFDLVHAFWSSVGEVPTISILESPFSDVSGWVKRVEDIVFSIIILTIIMIPMMLIAVIVKLTSPGVIIFKQKRYGMNGQIIKVWKFRSMLVCEDRDIKQVTKGDTRVTTFGAFLRRTSLDELPQFFNVLFGDMSIVGPRPHAVMHNEQYRSLIPGYMLRHKVPPGITGWAQVNGYRGETETLDKMEKRVEYDLWYIRNWSIFLDIYIIFKTTLTGFRGVNTY